MTSLDKRRGISSRPPSHSNPRVQSMIEKYVQLREAGDFGKVFRPMSSKEMFANTSMTFSDISVIGFDYDFTLCHYSEDLQGLIYNLALEHMVARMRYPDDMLKHLTYDKGFAIRGLSIDMNKGFICKMSALNKLSVVYRGRSRLSSSDIESEYGGNDCISEAYRTANMKPLNDLFSLSEACLVADVTQYFISRGIGFHPRLVGEDVIKAITFVHTSRIWSESVSKDLDRYLEPQPKLGGLLESLKANKKELFLATNNNFHYTDTGLKHIIGKDWRDLFDVVIVGARKPDFYKYDRSFRLFDPEAKQLKWERVNELKKGEIYAQGSSQELGRIKGWVGRQVLYFGDSIYSDLVEPSRMAGWRTGAVIRELENHLEVHHSAMYQKLRFTSELLRELLRHVQLEATFEYEKDDKKLFEFLYDELRSCREEIQSLYNKNFGDVFHAGNYESIFAFCVNRYVDLYTSHLENVLEYPLSYKFFPSRSYLSHESNQFFPSISEGFTVFKDEAFVSGRTRTWGESDFAQKGFAQARQLDESIEVPRESSHRPEGREQRQGMDVSLGFPMEEAVENASKRAEIVKAHWSEMQNDLARVGGGVGMRGAEEISTGKTGEEPIHGRGPPRAGDEDSDSALSIVVEALRRRTSSGGERRSSTLLYDELKINDTSAARGTESTENAERLEVDLVPGRVEAAKTEEDLDALRGSL